MDSLDAIAEYVIAAASTASLTKKTSDKLRLAVDEIATNIIIYGYEGAGRKGVLAMHADLDKQSLTISIEDTGVPYVPPQALALDNLDKPIEQQQIGDLEIYLAI